MKYAKLVAYRSLAVILAVLVTQQITTSIVGRLHQGVAAAGEPPQTKVKIKKQSQQIVTKNASPISSTRSSQPGTTTAEVNPVILPNGSFIKANFSMKPLEAFRNEDNSIGIHSSVIAFDNRGTHKFIWKLKVFEDTTNALISNISYPNSIFTILPDTRGEFEFKETLRLLPGSYRFQLELFGIPNAATFEEMKSLIEGDQSKVRVRVVSKSKKFLVANP